MKLNKFNKRLIAARRPFSVVERKNDPRNTGKWLNGNGYEYEYAYCSECGQPLWAGWESHKEAKKNIRGFADYYRYCPVCGAKMEGGEYVE